MDSIYYIYLVVLFLFLPTLSRSAFAPYIFAIAYVVIEKNSDCNG